MENVNNLLQRGILFYYITLHSRDVSKIRATDDTRKTESSNKSSCTNDEFVVCGQRILKYGVNYDLHILASRHEFHIVF